MRTAGAGQVGDGVSPCPAFASLDWACREVGPHLNAIVEMGVHGAPPPFGGGALERADSAAEASCAAVYRALLFLVAREYGVVPCVEATEILGTRPRMTEHVR